MSSNINRSQSDMAFGPGTDLILSLLFTAILLGSLTAGYNLYKQNLISIIKTQKRRKEEREDRTQTRKKEELEGKTIVLQDVPGGIQYFRKESAIIEEAAKEAIRTQMEDLRKDFETMEGEFIINIIGHVSPEPFKEDSDFCNFNLALERAKAIAIFLHTNFDVPYECLRVEGAGRSESKTLHIWLNKHNERTTADWDDMLHNSNTIEQKLAGERRVQIKRRLTHSPICKRAMKARANVSFR